MQISLVRKSYALKNPVGNGRDAPNVDPFLPVSLSVFLSYHHDVLIEYLGTFERVSVGCTIHFGCLLSILLLPATNYNSRLGGCCCTFQVTIYNLDFVSEKYVWLCVLIFLKIFFLKINQRIYALYFFFFKVSSHRRGYFLTTLFCHYAYF